MNISFEGWRADQVLTSDAFGLDTTRDEYTSTELEAYEELVSQDPREISEDDVQVLGYLKDSLNKKLPYFGETAEIRRYQKIIDVLTQKLEKYEKNDKN